MANIHWLSNNDKENKTCSDKIKMIMMAMAITHSQYYKDKHCITRKSNTENSHKENTMLIIHSRWCEIVINND
jgi:hypothetical protein